VVHGFDHQRETVGPVIARAGQEPHAHGVTAGHQSIGDVLDLVNTVCAQRWLANIDRRAPVAGAVALPAIAVLTVRS
jgi:hypothetical protein